MSGTIIFQCALCRRERIGEKPYRMVLSGDTKEYICRGCAGQPPTPTPALSKLKDADLRYSVSDIDMLQDMELDLE